MQKVRDLKSKFGNLSVNTASSYPTPKDSRHIKTDTLFGEIEEEAEKEENPRPEEKEKRLITNVLVRQSGALNSVRDTGMSKVQQLKFVEMLKRVIVDDAAVLYDNCKAFKIVTSRKEERPQSSVIFFEGAVYVAKLIDTPATEVVGGSERMLLEKSDECKFLANAVENLWEKVLSKTNGLQIGEPLAAQSEVALGASPNSTPSLQELATALPEAERAEFINGPHEALYTGTAEPTLRTLNELQAVFAEFEENARRLREECKKDRECGA